MLSIPMLKHNFKACIVPFIIIFAFLTMYTTVIIYMYDPKLAEMLEGYQEVLPEMMAAVGMTGVATSLIEWIKIYLYGFIMLLFPLIFIIIAVNKLVMGFIDNGSMAGILATSNSRGKIIITQLLSLYIWLFILMSCVTAVGIVTANILFPNELDIEKYLCLNAGTLMLWFAVAGITFLVACIFSDAKYYYLFGAGIPILFFFFNMIGNMGENLKFFNYFTIYSLLPADKLIAGNSEAVLPCVILFMISIVLSVTGGIWFTKRDLSL